MPGGNLTVRCELALIITELVKPKPASSPSQPSSEQPVIDRAWASSLYKSGLFTDVVFVLEDGSVQLPAHKLLLAAASPVFKEMFMSSGMKESTEGRVVITEVPAVFEQLLKFIYNGKVDGIKQYAGQLLVLADKVR